MSNWGKWKSYTNIMPVQDPLQGPPGPTGMKGDLGISIDQLRRILLGIGALSLSVRNIISVEEYTRIHEMIISEDKENWEVAEALIKQLNTNGNTDIHNNKGLH